jgi:hypothetical protein
LACVFLRLFYPSACSRNRVKKCIFPEKKTFDS